MPDEIYTVLTDHGIQFTNWPRGDCACAHLFDHVCHASGIDHRLAKTNHPWTNGQVEHMHRTLNDATVNQYHDQTHHHLKEQLQAFLMADNFAKRLKTLTGLTPYEYLYHCWPKEPERLTINPYHYTTGLNSQMNSTFRLSPFPGHSQRVSATRHPGYPYSN